MKQLCTLFLTLAFCVSTHAEKPDWTVTIEDFHGGSGVTYTHTITPDLIRTVQTTDNEGDEPVELNKIELNDKQTDSIRKALNKVPLDKLKDTYSPEKPLLGGSVHFAFELPGRKKKEVLVWQGARVKSLKRVVETINNILPEKYRIRAMD
jgi:hypothetical protein